MLSLKRALLSLHRREEGQMAFFMLLMVIVVFMFFAMSLDAGVWYFDHRTAQNQSEAAAMAAVLELPAADTTEARAKADEYLTKNGSVNTSSLNCPASSGATGIEFEDLNSDGKMDQVTVCVHRDSPSFFAGMANIDSVKISAQATARIGPVDIANVMPWYVSAPDPTCSRTAGRDCRADFNFDGDATDAGEFTCAFADCPYGLDLDAVYKFKGGGGGNSGAIQACGNGASEYGNCILGDTVSGFFEEGSSVRVEVKSGNMGVNTSTDLDTRYPMPARTACDVAISPGPVAAALLGSNSTQTAAHDPNGKARAKDKFDVNDPDYDSVTHADCPLRLVTIPIFDTPIPPNGAATVTVLGIAVFGIANWADPGNATFGANPNADCMQLPGNTVPAGAYDCGMVWGYLFTDIAPPNALLQAIGTSNNPFAPLLAALVD